MVRPRGAFAHAVSLSISAAGRIALGLRAIWPGAADSAEHGRVTRDCDWPYSSFHRYVKNGLLPADWGVDRAKMQGRFGE